MRLSDPLPLRSSSEWLEFQEVTPIPLRYGRDVWGRCLPYNQTLTEWVWAGHASQGIDTVTIDGVETLGFQAKNVKDSAGKPITLITLTDSLDPGRQVHAKGRGAFDSVTGALIDSPADVLFDLARIHGATLTRNDLTQFAQECSERNLRLSFSIEDAESPQAIVRRIADQLCAVYSPSLTGWVRLLPLSTTTTLVSVDDEDLTTADQSIDELATSVTARYAFRLGEPTQTAVIKAQGYVDEISVELELDMIADNTAVFDIVERTLQRRARRPFAIGATLTGRQPPGTAVALVSDELGITATVPVMTASYDADSNRTTCTLEAQALSTPVTLELVSTTEQVSALQRQILGGDSSPLDPITITNPDGLPLVGARVTLDGTVTRLTDSSGQVSFSPSLLTPGLHTFRVEAVGYSPFEFSQTF